MNGHIVSRSKVIMLGLLVISLAFIFAGCTGSNGAAGSSSGAISGTVTTATGAAPLAGVTVSTSPSAGTTTTDGSGNYSLSLPAGSYTITFALTNYTSGTTTANVAVGVTSSLNATMAEAASGQPTVTVAASGQNVGYGNPFNLTATATSPNGYPLSYVWSGATGTGTTATATATSLTTAMAGVAAPSSDPYGYVTPYSQENRFGILPITADTRGAKSVSVTANDGHGGSTKASVTVNAAGIQTGVKAVAVGLPVYMNSGIANDTTTTWTVTGPASSPTYSVSTALSAGRNPSFMPDVVGQYVVTTGTGTTLTLYAGTYAGAISGGAYVSKKITNTDPKWDSMWITVPSTGSSVTYTNWPVVTPDSGCLSCHNDGSIISGHAPDKFTPWTGTAHANFFSRGIENITSNGGTCLTCHTTGYDQAASAANNGFDDIALVEGFVYPTKGVGQWAAMVANKPQTTRRANIQCENCHGPQVTVTDPFTTTGAHGTTSNGVVSDPTRTTALRISYSSEVCATCHASGTGHHLYSEWLQLNPDTAKGHSKLAQLDATGYSGHARSTDDSCSRCHTAQGFSVYVDQLMSGNAGTLPASVITWDKSNALPQTCTACHDPHSDANPNQLRLYNTLPTTMAGFGVDGVGKGAVCMACHNNRNGIQCASAPTGTGLCVGGALSPTGATFLHEDGDANAALILDSMHDASQTEVLMGRDFFFMGKTLPQPSKHVNVEDTCVGCHMALNPQTHLSHGTPAVNSHNFFITDADRPKLCANCHSSSVDGEALVTFVEDQLAVLGQKMSANLLGRLSGTIYINKVALTITGTTAITYYDGSFYFNGTPGNITSGTKASLTNLTIDSSGTTPIIGPDDVLKKASWNWTMIERDGSYGIHNPSFITNVLANTIAQFP
jgi:hypothetical protein